MEEPLRVSPSSLTAGVKDRKKEWRCWDNGRHPLNDLQQGGFETMDRRMTHPGGTPSSGWTEVRTQEWTAWVHKWSCRRSKQSGPSSAQAPLPLTSKSSIAPAQPLTQHPMQEVKGRRTSEAWKVEEVNHDLLSCAIIAFYCENVAQTRVICGPINALGSSCCTLCLSVKQLLCQHVPLPPMCHLLHPSVIAHGSLLLFVPWRQCHIHDPYSSCTV